MIKTGQHLSQKQELGQKLSPQQIQYIKMLQLPVTALEQRITEEMEINPLLVDGDNDPDAETEDLSLEDPVELESEGEKEKEETEDYDEELEMKDLEDLDEDDWNELMHSDDIDSYQPRSGSQEEEDRSDLPNKYERTQLELLEEQLQEMGLSDREKLIADQILWSIEDNGYFEREIQSVIDGIAFNHSKIVTEDEVISMLKRIQRLDPPGIAARDLRECLMVQLEVEGYEDDPISTLAYRILDEEWTSFEKKHFDKLKKKFDIDTEELTEVFDEIKRLNPKPGVVDLNIPIEHNHIEPDFFVREKDDDDPYNNVIKEDKLHVIYKEFIISLNKRNKPSLGISRKYKKMFEDLKKQQKMGGNKEKLKETQAFIKEKMETAKWFIDSINQRKNTLLAVMETIVMLQEEFFRTGKGIKPMILKDVADRIKMDISTISRVANGKYVQTHYGIYELKYFFNEGVMTDSGEEVANRVVKNALQKIVDEEDKDKPLSDQALAKELKAIGYPVARRTVSKYREQLNIPVARLRKQLI